MLTLKLLFDLIWPWLHLMNFREFFASMKGTHQVEPKQEIPLCRIQSSGSEKEQLAREILKNAREMTNEIPSGAKAGKSQNRSFPLDSRRNSDEINIKKF